MFPAWVVFGAFQTQLILAPSNLVLCNSHKKQMRHQKGCTYHAESILGKDWMVTRFQNAR